MEKLIKYIIEVNTNGSAYDVEVYAASAHQARELVIMRNHLPDYAVRVRGEA